MKICMGSLIRSFTKSTIVPPWICLVIFWCGFVIFPAMGFWSSLGCQACLSFCKENVKYNQKVVNPIAIKPPWHHSKHLFWQGSFVNHWVSMLMTSVLQWPLQILQTPWNVDNWVGKLPDYRRYLFNGMKMAGANEATEGLATRHVSSGFQLGFPW